MDRKSIGFNLLSDIMKDTTKWALFIFDSAKSFLWNHKHIILCGPDTYISFCPEGDIHLFQESPGKLKNAKDDSYRFMNDYEMVYIYNLDTGGILRWLEKFKEKIPNYNIKKRNCAEVVLQALCAGHVWFRDIEHVMTPARLFDIVKYGFNRNNDSVKVCNWTCCLVLKFLRYCLDVSPLENINQDDKPLPTQCAITGENNEHSVVVQVSSDETDKTVLMKEIERCGLSHGTKTGFRSDFDSITVHHEEIEDIIADIMQVKAEEQVARFCGNCQCKDEAKNKDNFSWVEDQKCFVCKMTEVSIVSRKLRLRRLSVSLPVPDLSTGRPSIRQFERSLSLTMG